jgi:hypothetical protein
MELSYTTKDGRMTVKLSGETQKDIFKELAKFQEVFELPTCKNKAGEESTDTRFIVRNVDDNEYYEVQCIDVSKPNLLYSKIAYGCHKKGGGLFPKNGRKWVKYDSKDKKTFEIATGNEVKEE